MKSFKSQKSFLNTQNLYFPKKVYNNYGHRTKAFINVAETYQVLGKICLNEDLSLENCCFIDHSVVLPKNNWKNFQLESVKDNNFLISESDINALRVVKEAQLIEVIAVYNDITTAVKVKNCKTTIEKLIKEYLNMFYVCNGCIVFCEAVPELRCKCIIVTQVSGKPCDAFEINEKTIVVVKDVISVEKFGQIQTFQDDYIFKIIFTGKEKEEKVGTFQKLAEIIDSTINCPIPSSSFLRFKIEKNILIVGPPGCGKTTMVNFIAKKCQKVLLVLPCGDLSLSTFIQKMPQTIEKAKLHVKANEPCIILLKDIHCICMSKNDRMSNMSIQAIKQVISCLEDVHSICEISVVATSPEDIDPMLKRLGCFSQELEIPMLTEDDREKVFQCLAQAYGIDCVESSAKAVARWTPGYLLADLVAVIRESKTFLQKMMSTETIKLECFKKSVSRTQPSTLIGTRGLIATRKTTFADIGGLEKVKKILRTSVQWQLDYPEAFARLGIPPTRGILLYGPPGCAKTTLVKALACEANVTFLAVSAADLYSPYVGEAEKRLSMMFKQARINAPTIIFIDEIDALVGTKDGNRDHGVQERILATLLMEMDGVGVNITTSDALTKVAEGVRTHESPKIFARSVDSLKVIVVAASNRPELVDDALKRPGRFDKLIYIPPPDACERFAILQKVTSGMALGDDIDLQKLAESTEHFSGADLKMLSVESALLALTERGMNVPKVLLKDYKAVLKNFRPSLSRKMCESN